ncbi:MAG: citryl-CoA lyase [Deltaproteobacteria bacterium SG8_13]|nr:MAG: citryl-CoA lyase [Deltaproteobacteria bacterium SG8_13]
MKPRRSILSVPGHIAKMHRKASQSPADAVMLDLEDSVPVNEKDSARKTVIRSLESLDWGAKTVTARINSLETAFGYRDLIALAEKGGLVLDAVVIPKVDHCADVHFADRLLRGAEMHRGLTRPIGIEAIIESAAGLEKISEIAGASDRLKTLVFGVADYSASIGARLVSLSGHGEKEETLYPGHRWNFALSRIVMTAKAHGLMAIDAPYGNYADPEGLQRSASIACALGCDGKWAIHPSQIDLLNTVFSPSAEDIDRARRVLEAYDEARAKGRGAASVDGRMIDAATVRLAQQLWDRAKQLGLVKS